MRKKGFLLKTKAPIWIVSDNRNMLYPIQYEYRNKKGYKGLVFSARYSEVEYENETVYRFWKRDWSKSVLVKWSGNFEELNRENKEKIMKELGVDKWADLMWELSLTTKYDIII